MSLSAKYLPRATPLDPAEDPPGSVDPLGTLGPAERIAEVLFPGFTARMWRPRLLTFVAVVALVTERAKSKLSNPENGSLSARLSFERLFVSAVVRQHVRDPENWQRATRRLPGSLLARRALLSGDTLLGRTNFLKGQAVNGPYGVVARLARHLGVIDEDDLIGRNGEELLLAWSAGFGHGYLFPCSYTSFTSTAKCSINKVSWGDNQEGVPLKEFSRLSLLLWVN